MADAICVKLIAEGVDPKKARSRSFAIATKQLQRFGYLKPGTATPTAKGAGKIGAIMRRNPKVLTRAEAEKKAIALLKKAEKLVPEFISGSADETAFWKLRDKVYDLEKISYGAFSGDDATPYSRAIQKLYEDAKSPRDAHRKNAYSTEMARLREEDRKAKEPYDWMRNPDAVAGLTATIEAIQRNWTDVVSRASLTGQLLAGIKAARKEIAVSFDKKTLRQIIKIAVELLNKLRGRSGVMRKFRKNPGTLQDKIASEAAIKAMFAAQRAFDVHSYNQGAALAREDLQRILDKASAASKAWTDACWGMTEKGKTYKKNIANVREWVRDQAEYLGVAMKKNPQKRKLKRNGAGMVTHNGHVITIQNSVYTVQPYKKAFSGPDGFVRAKKWIDAHVLRESGQGWKLKANPRRRKVARRHNPKAGTWSNSVTTSTLHTKDGKIVVTNVKRYLERFVGNSAAPGWYAYFVYSDVGGPVSLWHVGPFRSRSSAKTAGKKRLKPLSNPRRRIRRKNPAMKYDAAKNKYKFFVLQHNTIAGGFEYREDANDLMKELKARNQIAKVLTRVGVVRLGIDPGVNANWHRTNPRRRK